MDAINGALQQASLEEVSFVATRRSFDFSSTISFIVQFSVPFRTHQCLFDWLIMSSVCFLFR